MISIIQTLNSIMKATASSSESDITDTLCFLLVSKPVCEGGEGGEGDGD